MVLLLICIARKRSGCVSGVLFECSVDPFPFRLFSSSMSFLNPFMLLLRVLLLCAGLSFRSGMVCSVSITLNQRVVALLNAGCRKVLPR
ncbi:Hypothetical protein c5171 [Escherichia coli CFT073]|uniref:Uncharacterized protein n=1 Tax=Escherichia coli O6:H1 (strain CFT073 / ATCC 700928 / UPEC) TaxID=199310 RepID=A0A0H2VDF4_ECOL6|nr:Hypothetical protein c5171 [Escherichia coli CFT073]